MVDRMRQMKFPKHTKLWTIIGVVILLIVVLGITAFDFVTEYIWMDSLSFGGIYTKILYTKLLLEVTGFVLFCIIAFIASYYIRDSYMNHVSYILLAPLVEHVEYDYALLSLAALVIGLFGSRLIDGMG